MPLDVADHQGDEVTEIDDVVPISPDLGEVAARRVPAGEVEPLDGRELVGEQALLKGVGDEVLVLVAAGALHYRPDLDGELLGGGHVALGEATT